MITDSAALAVLELNDLIIQVILYLRYGILLLLGALAALALAVTWKG